MNYSSVPALQAHPSAIDVERSVLASMIIDETALDDAMELLNDEVFHHGVHQKIFICLQDLYKNDKPVDVTILIEELRKKEWLQAVGGDAYIAELIGGTATSANIIHHVEILKDKAVLRKLISAAGKITTEAMAADAISGLVLDKAEQNIFSIKDKEMVGQPEEIATLLGPVFVEIDTYRKKAGVSGVPSGFIELDKLTTGMHPGELIIIAARPGMGKTSFALSIALNASCKSTKPHTVAIFSLEMPKNQLVQRMLCSEAEVDIQRLRSGDILPKDMARLTKSANILHTSKIFIDDSGSLNVMELRAKCRRIKNKGGSLDLVIIDYLQLMTGVERSENRQNEISTISRSLKEIAKELRLPIIALSQLSRAVEQRAEGKKRPMLSDLRESGSIEQDADVVLFIYRDKAYDRNSADGDVAEIIISKQRNGQSGVEAKVVFNDRFASFSNLDKVHGADELIADPF